MWRFHQLQSGFLANGRLPRASHKSRLSTNNDDNMAKPGVVYRSPGIFLTAEENLGKSQLGDGLMKSMRPVIASNGIPYLQMRSIGPHSTPGREKEGKK